MFVPGVLHTYLKYRDRKGYPNQVCLLILIWIAEIVWHDRLTVVFEVGVIL